MIHVDESDPVGEIEPPFQYRDVTIKRNTDVNDFFDMLSEIGRGKFGTVYLCREKSSGLELAAKLVSVNRRDERRNVEREVEVMRRLRHPRLIQLYDAYDWGKYMCVVLELITGGELFERVIDEDFVLTERACTVFMRQICEGIEFVHRQNILHLDMKPENILCLTKAGNRIKIIDFGLARFYDPEKKLQVLFGTPEFVAPEVVNFDQIGYGTDMWSIGVICYVLLSGLSPFMGETDIETMANVTIAKYDFDDEAFNEISEDAKDFIKKLLVKDKESRPSATECLRHRWLVKRPPVTQEKPREQTRLSHKQELDMAKDNLRLFVERWSEHPNSPYVFDNESQEILTLVNCERSSIGGCSPSPRSSLSSSPDIVFDEDDLDFEPPPPREPTKFKTRYNPVERRASDSSCFLHKRPDVLVRKNLAEEIKKLSDHLFMLSTMNTDLTNNNSMKEMDKNVLEKKVSREEKKTQNGFKTETESTFKKIYTNGDAKSEKTVFMSKSSHKINSTFLKEKEPERPMTSKMPWVKTRSKRVTSTSRDVPDQPTDKRNTFFEEFDRRRDKIDKLMNGYENGRQMPYRRGDENNAHRTKDLLLHLLEKWGETEEVEAERSAGGTSNGGRHQSISLEWSPSNELAQNSMSSLHAFFRRQTSDEKMQRTKLTNNITSSK
ncbi:myosin light chain kinase, smooth muscle-like [Colias croceus]|uniref:myosin light chain kinase, smooth muscle-like n=1 Tax=Colias crocea TaxID=72248 RepID=UPI001E27CB18|nr:myosin light chain kinase, smooth muscle-like [Colias croceus]